MPAYQQKSIFESLVAGAFVVAGTVLIGFVLAAFAAFFAGIVFWLTWNNGVVHLVSATGGQWSSISYWTAYFTAWFAMLLGSILIKGVGSIDVKSS